MYNLQIVTCAHRDITTNLAKSMEKLRKQTTLFYDWAIFSGDALIGRSRSRACTQYYDVKTAPYMLFIDDDIEFEVAHVERIYLDLIQGYHLIGGAYAVKDGSQLASFGWKGAVDFGGQIESIQFLATGFMGISWECLDRIRKGLDLQIVNPADAIRCYPFFESGAYHGEQASIYISEDWDFCNKARQVGIESYLDTTVWLGHRGTKIYTVDMVIESQEAELKRRNANTKGG